ncbi:MFS transporter [Actinokineospora sp. NPDC004072]
MTETTAQSSATGMSEPKLRLTIAVDYLLSNFGRFSLMPVLAVLLAVQSDGAEWLTTGVGLFGFMLCAGLSALLVTKWLPRFTYVTSMTASMAFSAVGFGLLAHTTHPLAAMGLLFVAGFGISVHAVLVRVLVAEVVPSETGRNNLYSIQQIATNAAAAFGPFIAGALYVSGDGRPLLTFVAGAYVLAGLSLLVGLPRGLRPPDTVRERGRGVAAGLRMLRDPECRGASAVTAIGSFAYAQFYSAFALLVALAVDSTLLRGALLAGPPIAIVIFQVLVTMAVNRYLRAGVRPLSILIVATALFGVAVVFLGVGLPVVLAATVAMAVFAVAEMIFTPMVSTTFNRISGVSRLAASNLQGVAWTAGEALGSLAGGALFLLAYQNGIAAVYWLALAAVTVACVVPFWRTAADQPVIERTTP